MTVPNWYELLLLGLASFRVWRLLAEDIILDWPRNRSFELAFRLGGPRLKDYWDDFLSCLYCAGFWVGVAWWGAWLVWPHGALVAAVPFAISAVVGLIASLD